MQDHVEDSLDPRAETIAVARDMAGSDAFRAALADLIGFRTDASLPEGEDEIADYLDYIEAGLIATGFETERTQAEGRPFLVARRIEDATRPTVLLYSHGDTVPGMEGQWREGRDP